VAGAAGGNSGQTGQTRLPINLMHFLNAKGRYRALCVNIEAAQAAR
jgi:hypothetical protein